MRVAENGHRGGQAIVAADRPVFGLEAKFIDDVPRAAALVIVDADRVEHVVVEVEIVGTVGRILARIYIHDERHPPIGWRTRQVGGVVADEGVDVGIVGGGLERDEWCFAMARCLRRGSA